MELVESRRFGEGGVGLGQKGPLVWGRRRGRRRRWRVNWVIVL